MRQHETRFQVQKEYITRPRHKEEQHLFAKKKKKIKTKKTMAVPKAAAKLREYLADPEKVVVCPGVHDGLTARVALSVGFDALYMVSPTLPQQSACVPHVASS